MVFHHRYRGCPMPYAGELSAIITVFLWSASSMIFTSAALKVGAMQVNISRLVIGMAFLWITILFLGISFSLSWAQIMYLSLSSLVGLVFGDTFLFKAFELIGARLSMLIMSLAPAIAALLAYIFLHETISVPGLIGMAMTLSGIIYVVYENPEENRQSPPLHSSRGALYGLLGALGQGGGLVLAKLAFDDGEIHGLVASSVRTTVAVLCLAPLLWFTGRLRNPVMTFRQNPPAFRAVLAGSIAGPYLGITFSLIAIMHTEVGIASTIMAMVPVLLLPMERIFHKRPMTWRSSLGTIWAVSGVAVLFVK